MKKKLYLVTLTSSNGVAWNGAFETVTEANKFVSDVKDNPEIMEYFTDGYGTCDAELISDVITLYSGPGFPALNAIDDLMDELFLFGPGIKNEEKAK